MTAFLCDSMAPGIAIITADIREVFPPTDFEKVFVRAEYKVICGFFTVV